MSSVKTTFVNDKNPFFDPSNMKINLDKKPPYKKRLFRQTKYVETFEKMKIGTSVTVPLDYRRRVHESLRNYIKVNEKPGMIRSFSNDPTKGLATVYWLEA